MKSAKVKRSFAAILIASVMTVQVGTAQALIGELLGEATGTVISPFITTTAGFISSTATTAANKKEAYLAAAAEAANYVQAEGLAPVSALLQEVMGFEQAMVSEVYGVEAAKQVSPIEYAQLVVVRTEKQFKTALQ